MSVTKYGLIGHPLGHSLSPYIHERIMESAGIRGHFDLYDIHPDFVSSEIPKLLRELDGCSVTIPYKSEIIPYLYGLDPSAASCKAVNTVFERRGYNTDIDGFLSAAPNLDGKKVLLLGAGGVSRMMAFEAARRSCSVRISARNSAKAHALADELRAAGNDSCNIEVLPNEDLRAAADCEVILNGTPLGMWPLTGESPLPEAALRPGQEIFDTVYNPAATRLVLHARKAGATATGGLSMLFAQALAAQKIWHPGTVFDDAELRDIRKDLALELPKRFPVKYILSGFMGAGKTTVARTAAARLGIAAFDLDEAVVRARGISVAEIFRRDGEAGFRKTEAAVLSELLSRPQSAIIACGGGALIEEPIRDLIRQNGALTVYLHASLDCLWTRVGQDAGRPMLHFPEEDEAARFSRVARLYETRLPIYRMYCDYICDAQKDLNEVTDDVVAALGYGGIS